MSSQERRVGCRDGERAGQLEHRPAMVLERIEGSGSFAGVSGSGVDFHLDIMDKSVGFRITAIRAQARLSDVALLGRALSNILMSVVWDCLKEEGRFVACRKGCSACCNYLIPLSVPEAFRLREELFGLPPERFSKLLASFGFMSQRILKDRKNFPSFQQASKTNVQITANRVGRWYANLKLSCPFLSQGLCTSYQERPIACREHLVMDSPVHCVVHFSDTSRIVQIPISILDVLTTLTAKLEGSEPEAVMLPLVPFWAEDHLERAERYWPSVEIMESLVEILQTTAVSDCGCLSGRV